MVGMTNNTARSFVFSGHIVHSNNHDKFFQSAQQSVQMIKELQTVGINSETGHSDLFFH